MPTKILSLAAFVATTLATQLKTEAKAQAGPNMLPNLRPGLVPPEGTMWRGATIDTNGVLSGGWMAGADPDEFEEYYGQPLHIYRQFNESSNAGLTEWKFIEEGGIIFYSIQPKDWALYASGMKDWEIRKYARSIAEAAPHQIMVPVGYEPDLYVPEKNGEGAEKNRGTIADYHAMWEHFAEIFEEEGACNAVFILDFSWDIREDLHLIEMLWPKNVNIQWLFFNMFQFQRIKPGSVGDCLGNFDKIYQYLDSAPETAPWKDLPWGLGAWGSPMMQYTPFEDKVICIDGTRQNLEDRERYPKMKASISFNSLTSRVDEE